MKFSYQNAGVSQEQLAETVGKLTSYHTKLKYLVEKGVIDVEESFVNLPFNEENVKTALDMAKKTYSDNLQYIIVIGIGGSNLGTKAAYDAVYGHYDLLEPQRFPKILFVDTVETDYLRKLKNLLLMINDPGKILINVISKSGSTLETIANFEIILSFFHHKDRVVVTTDTDSKLWDKAAELGLKTLPIPPKIGGRYSVFTSVGLYPLTLCGIDTVALLEGAMFQANKNLTGTVGESEAALSAAVIYANHQKGKTVYDNFYFGPELETLGRWYRQLLGESLGKEGKGLTPTFSVGSTDLHSVGQLYLGGPQDKFFTFTYVENEMKKVQVPEELTFKGLAENIEGKSTLQIKQALVEGVKSAWTKKSVPFSEMVLSDTSEKSLGEYMQFKMLEIVFLAELFRVNAFNQPNVEDYKIETKRILSTQN